MIDDAPEVRKAVSEATMSYAIKLRSASGAEAQELLDHDYSS